MTALVKTILANKTILAHAVRELVRAADAMLRKRKRRRTRRKTVGY